MGATEEARPAGMLPRLLFLVLLMLGVVSMHTLGRLDGHEAAQRCAAGMLHAEDETPPCRTGGGSLRRSRLS